ncbi:MAG: alpha/beta hydrolase [Pseudomonadota bacterium]
MKLVLLPGLNGSSALFAPLLPHLSVHLEVESLALPDKGPQDYPSLAQLLAPRLQAIGEPFVLLGESFSSALAYRLAQARPVGLRGVIFVSGFVRRPHPLLALWPLLRYLPLPIRLATRPSLLRCFCLGPGAAPAQLEGLGLAIRTIPEPLLRARLDSLNRLTRPVQPLDLPSLHLRPLQDRLVMPHAAASLAQHCPHLQQLALPGPHFLLQRHPEACAEAIERFIAALPGTADS